MLIFHSCAVRFAAVSWWTM